MRKKRAQWIPVVAGLIKKNDEVLLGKRPEGLSLAGVWEFPGGKIEPGEHPQSALKRELAEELGINATVGSLKFSTTHSYGETNILLLFYAIPFWQGEPRTKHHESLKWTKISDLEKQELPEANRKALSDILQALNEMG
ncbi:MAG: 8-oxo-dGTP diphosphatase MutT [Bdellovibrionales bacterium]|nr:8-oxo-dGTP diphosphatase MutT [Bdellovibrionales bacterium]